MCIPRVAYCCQPRPAMSPSPNTVTCSWTLRCRVKGGTSFWTVKGLKEGVLGPDHEHKSPYRSRDSSLHWYLDPYPKGPRYQIHIVFRVSLLGMLIMVQGRYLMFWYLDPEAMGEWAYWELRQGRMFWILLIVIAPSGPPAAESCSGCSK